jgi:hypothetical protein
MRTKIRKNDGGVTVGRNRLPSLAAVEAAFGPAATWAGRCYAIACACVEEGFVRGTAVYGHWRGEVCPDSYFGRLKQPAMPFHRHGWVAVSGRSGMIFDPTRWMFTGAEPFLYLGLNRGEYDEGGNRLRQGLLRPPPVFDPYSREIFSFSQRKLSPEAWSHLERLLGSSYLVDLGDAYSPGDVSFEQLFWIANLPCDALSPYVREIYRVIADLGREAWIPIDNLRMAKRPCLSGSHTP